MQCKAKSKRSGEQCKKDAVLGKEVCHMHGGKSLSGIAAPGYKHGLRSKCMPARLQDKYHEALHDPDLLALREDLAVVEARISDVLGRVDTGEAGALWSALDKQYKAILEIDRDDGLELWEAIKALGEVIEQGKEDWRAWHEVLNLIESRRKLVETERKRLVDMQQMITAERAMLLITAIMKAVKDHVHDRDTLAAIARDVGRLTNKPGD